MRRAAALIQGRYQTAHEQTATCAPLVHQKRELVLLMKKQVLASTNANAAQPHRVRLPGFVMEDEIGLGDAIKRITYSMGIKPCSGCEKRAAALNRWVTFHR
jgi:hypothetical protein